jgi:hypothetical protein
LEVIISLLFDSIRIVDEREYWPMEFSIIWKRELESAFSMPLAVPFAGLKEKDGIDLGRKDFAFVFVISVSLVSCRKSVSGFIEIC